MTQQYQYSILNGPAEMDLVFSLMRGHVVTFTARKKTGDKSVEGWSCIINILGFDPADESKTDGYLQIRGNIIMSSHRKGRFEGFYDMKKRKGDVIVYVES